MLNWNWNTVERIGQIFFLFFSSFAATFTSIQVEGLVYFVVCFFFWSQGWAASTQGFLQRRTFTYLLISAVTLQSHITSFQFPTAVTCSDHPPVQLIKEAVSATNIHAHLKKRFTNARVCIVRVLSLLCAGAMVHRYFPSLFQLFSLPFLGENGKDSDS